MKIAVVGAGYVGLVVGAGFAKLGHDVHILDIDENRIGSINKAEPPFFEEGLEPLLREYVGKGIKATTDVSEAVHNAEVIFICVQTDCDENGGIDLTHIREASKSIGEACSRAGIAPLVVVKSTVIPGTTENVVYPALVEAFAGGNKNGVRVAFNPEFLQEGKALANFFAPDRIIIGDSGQNDSAELFELYRGFDVPVLRLSIRTAEMIKYASNSFLATKISFINEIGNICKKMGVDVYDVARGMGLDPRISPHFLKAGIGFGGSCLPKDTRTLISAAKELGYNPSLLESVLEVNEQQPRRMVEIAREKFGDLAGRRVTMLGLTFKPDTDDIRDASSLKIIGELEKQGARIMVYDPAAMETVRRMFGGRLEYAASAGEAVAQADVVFIVTEWDEFRDPRLYRGKKVVDGRRVLQLPVAEGISYHGICW